jgi:hypothetical protein
MAELQFFLHYTPSLTQTNVGVLNKQPSLSVYAFELLNKLPDFHKT